MIEYNISLVSLYAVNAVIYLLIFVYGLMVLQVELLRWRESKIPIGTIKIALSATISSLMLAWSSITNILLVFDPPEEDVISFIGIATLLFGSVGSTIALYSLIMFILLAIKALTLAKRGVSGTRLKWFKLYNKNLSKGMWIVAFVAFALCVLTANGGIASSYIFATIYSLITIGLSLLAIKFRNVARDTTTQQTMSETFREFFWVVIAFVIPSVTGAIYYWFLLPTWPGDLFMKYVNYFFLSSFIPGPFLIVRFVDVTNKKNKPTQPPQDPSTANDDTSTGNQIQTKTASEPLPTRSIRDGVGNHIGEAPYATRPIWLPQAGAEQSTVDPRNWSISLENLVQFLHQCMDTDTWKALVTAKGEGNICMHDINEHFVKPWTKGTGSSLAGLIDHNQGSVDLMISHSWSGSTKETLSVLESLPALYCIPKETRMFFCTMCLYQADDDHQPGLTIKQQLELEPFSKVIGNDPTHGMYVFHTTNSEVYERLWCVHEINECIHSKVDVIGAFDLSSWNIEKFKRVIKKTKTCEAECQGKDKEMLTKEINERGGFDLLDDEIKRVRHQSMADMVSAQTYQWLFGSGITTIDRFVENTV